MSVVSNNILAGASGQGGGGYEIERSLRFNAPDSSYLNRTPSSAGNRKTWTMSYWVKRARIGEEQMIFSAAESSSNRVHFYYPNEDLIAVYSHAFYYTLQDLARDPAAWMHLVFACDTTQSTDTNRFKIYKNGVLADSFLNQSHPAQNLDTTVNGVFNHQFSGRGYTSDDYADAYLAEVNFIDGQALDSSSFGEFDDNGVWQAKEFEGTHGPLLDQSQTWSNLVSTTDSLRSGGGAFAYGALSTIFDGNLANGVGTNSGNLTLSFSSGISTSNSTVEVYIYHTYSATITAGGSTYATNTGTSGDTSWVSVSGVSGTITSIVVSGSGSVGTCGGIKIDGKLLVDSGVTVPDNGFRLPFTDNSSNAALGTDTSGNSNNFTVHNLNAGASTPNYTSGLSYVGFSGTTTFSGDGPGGVGAFDGSETTRLTGDVSSGASQTAIYTWVPPGGSISASSFKLRFQYFGTNSFGTTSVSVNGGSYYTQSGSTSTTTYDFSSLITGGQITEVKVKWVSNQSGIGAAAWYAMYINNVLLVDADPTDSDSLVDSPTNGTASSGGDPGGSIVGNYATLNPLHPLTTATLVNGNLQTTSSYPAFATFLLKSGKWYCEHTVTATGYNLCFTQIDHPSGNTPSDSGSKSIGWYTNGTVYYGAGSTSGAGSYAAGDVLGAAIDMDNSTIKLYKNGTLTITIDFSTGTYHRFVEGMYVSQFNGTGHFNFGQRAFSNSNVPSGYKSLNTANLPEPTIADGSQYFDTVLWSGDGSGAITVPGLSLNNAPGFVWSKTRNHGYHNNLWDAVRGFGSANALVTDGTYAEGAANGGTLNSATSSSLTFSGGVWHNQSGKTYAAWAWDAGSSNTTIAAGSLNSSVYDQSQTWSNSLTSDIGFAAAATQAFDGNTSTSGSSNTGGTLTFAPNLTIPANSTIEGWFGYSSTDSGATMRVTVNGVVNNSVPGDSWRTLNYNGSTTLSSFTVFRDGSTNSAEIRAIRINGKILVDSGVSVPNVPSIASTVRANPSAGFSIVSYTGVTGNQNFGHGLNVKPKFILIKNRSNSADWFAMFDTGATHYQHGYLNGTSQFHSASAQPVTSSTITYGNNNSMFGANGDNYVAYCFAPVEGYSAMGSYQGNGNAEGVFVHTGFKIAWLMVKRTDAANDWVITDGVRNTSNVVDKGLYADLSSNESTATRFDFVSNGFKIRNTLGEINASGGTYIYYAIASHPFKTSRAR